MAHYFIDDPKRIILTVPDDLATAVSGQVVYRTPGGTVGAWSATLDIVAETVTADVPEDVLDEAGEWRLHAKITMSDGLTYHGDTVAFEIKELYRR